MILEAIINGKIIYNCITAEINTIFFRYLKHYNKDTHEGALISQKLEVHKYLLPGINFKKLKPLLYFLEMEKLRCKEIVSLHALFFRVNTLSIKNFKKIVQQSLVGEFMLEDFDSHSGKSLFKIFMHGMGKDLSIRCKKKQLVRIFIFMNFCSTKCYLCFIYT